MKRLVLATAILLAVATSVLASPPHAEGCAFRTTPDAYEAPRDRAAYLIALELTSHNRLASDDAFFGTPNVETGLRGERSIVDVPYIPPTLLKAIGWVESALAQAGSSVPWASVGPALISFDCGHGIMQITSGMTSPAGADGLQRYLTGATIQNSH